MEAWTVVAAGVAGFVLGWLIAYEVGHKDGEDQVTNYYEAKRKKICGQ